MRRLTVLVVTLTLVATAASACGSTSKLDKDTDVSVSGTVQDPDGKPLAGARVVLAKEVDFGEAVLGLPFVAATLGAICLADPAPAVCSKAQRATTDAEGKYSFTLKGRDTQGTVGTASTFHLSLGASIGASGASNQPSVSARFQIQRAELEVPTLRLWAPRLELTTGRTLRSTWEQRDRSASERLVFSDSNTPSNIIWAAAGRSPLQLDPRLLEDAKGTALVESDSNDEQDDTRFQITHRSAPVEFATAAVPPSRNVPCTPEPCVLTDGNLGPPPPATAPPTRQETTVDLTRSSTPTLIVVRGCPAACDVDTSVDGLSWKVVGSGQDPFFTVTPVLGTPVRFVKLRSVSNLNQVAEVSVWLA